jgi:galactosamine-6-phosphate isomerase
MSQLSCDSVISTLKNKPKPLICVATGNSPTGLYGELANYYVKEPEVFKELRVVKLDEWGGIDPNDIYSCERYIRNNILTPLHISDKHFISFESNPDDPIAECRKIQRELDDNGPLDICVLGLGKNGHIGFNEPAKELNASCHVAQLSTNSLQHEMTTTMKHKPTYGLTLGMADILKSKKIILLISGIGKEHILKQFLTQKITPFLPASFLWLHPNVECYLDSESCNGKL